MQCGLAWSEIVEVIYVPSLFTPLSLPLSLLWCHAVHFVYDRKAWYCLISLSQDRKTVVVHCIPMLHCLQGAVWKGENIALYWPDDAVLVRDNTLGLNLTPSLPVHWNHWGPCSSVLSVSSICSSPQVQEYVTRFESIPDMLELDHLTVSGDVTFGKQVSLKVGLASGP